MGNVNQQLASLRAINSLSGKVVVKLPVALMTLISQPGKKYDDLFLAGLFVVNP